MNKDNADRLKEIREEMLELLEEASNIVRKDMPRHEYDRAQAYWLGHIECALGSDSYPTHSPTMLDTVEACDEDWDAEADTDELPACIGG